MDMLQRLLRSHVIVFSVVFCWRDQMQADADVGAPFLFVSNCRWAQDLPWSCLCRHAFGVMDELDFELLHAKVLGAESRQQVLQGRGSPWRSELPEHCRCAFGVWML